MAWLRREGCFREALGAFIFIFLPEMNELNVSGLDKEAEVRGAVWGGRMQPPRT